MKKNDALGVPADYSRRVSASAGETPSLRYTANAPARNTRPDFMARPWWRDPSWVDFKVGSCKGLYQAQPGRYIILSLVSDDPGNGDFDHAMHWFYASCKRDNFDLYIAEIGNKRLGAHLIGKRNFLPVYGMSRTVKLEHALMP